PDMWGLAATLYTLLTGHPADKLGKSAYFWPPQGEKSVHRETWLSLHRLVLAATHEQKADRLPDLDAFAAGLAAAPSSSSGTGLSALGWGRMLARDVVLFAGFTLGGALLAGEMAHLGHWNPDVAR